MSAEYLDIMDDFGDEEEFAFVSHGGGDADDDKFDMIVGKIEEIIMEPEFEDEQSQFLDEYAHEFEDTEENKLVYMEIFQKYVGLIETILEKRLVEEIPEFSMEEFLELLLPREDQICGDVFDILLSFADFESFKQLCIAHKNAGDFSDLAPVVTHMGDDDEGFGLTIG
eukprot:TRINITY_DN169_c1_g1_i5.p1 TRINITY_DN169_c1_g1~~TRINITY_DN169_c1_g1_i5.p1  ORF type:complete len:169 (+),score=82.36 TRINITY_DN169_c1_g1_i5:168-674(+)